MDNSPSYRILLVEDLPSDAYLVRREVKKVLDPCEFMVVDDPDDFVAALREFRPGFILSDYNIPGFGWKLALTLAREYAPGIRFIIVTGSVDDSIRRQCLECGVDGFVSKNNLRELRDYLPTQESGKGDPSPPRTL